MGIEEGYKQVEDFPFERSKSVNWIGDRKGRRCFIFRFSDLEWMPMYIIQVNIFT
jgi:hypothetical protein